MKDEIDYVWLSLKILFGLGFIGLAIVSIIVGFKFIEVNGLANAVEGRGDDVAANSLIAFFIFSGILGIFLGVETIYSTLEKFFNRKRLNKKLREIDQKLENIEKIKCPSCGKLLSVDSKFCDYCGHELKK